MAHDTRDVVGTVGSENLAVLLAPGDTTLAQPLVQEHGQRFTESSQLKEESGNTFLRLFCI